MDRVYLPGDWMAEAGITVAALDAQAADPALRQVLDRCLDGVEALLVDAARLPGQLANRRLALESADILRIAERLTILLRRPHRSEERRVGQGGGQQCQTR